MDYKKVEATEESVVLSGVKHFNLEQILDCGQCFRWEKLEEMHYSGIAMGRKLEVKQCGEHLYFYHTSLEEFHSIWHPYFDFERNYEEIKALLDTEQTMSRAVAFCPGMRVLRQEPWEALVSFIISQNNNIPRIKGIVQRLCQAFGEELPCGGFGFPAPERLAQVSEEEIGEIRSGFRGKYILDAAKLVNSGQLDLQALYYEPLGHAREQLMKIKGVGPKVAECALLYGFARAECFPVDVWIKRALEQLYPEGFPAQFTEVAGIAQQYLFHYMRKCHSKEEAVAPA